MNSHFFGILTVLILMSKANSSSFFNYYNDNDLSESSKEPSLYQSVNASNKLSCIQKCNEDERCYAVTYNFNRLTEECNCILYNYSITIWETLLDRQTKPFANLFIKQSSIDDVTCYILIIILIKKPLFLDSTSIPIFESNKTVLSYSKTGNGRQVTFTNINGSIYYFTPTSPSPGIRISDETLTAISTYTTTQTINGIVSIEDTYLYFNENGNNKFYKAFLNFTIILNETLPIISAKKLYYDKQSDLLVAMNDYQIVWFDRNLTYVDQVNSTSFIINSLFFCGSYMYMGIKNQSFIHVYKDRRTLISNSSTACSSVSGIYVTTKYMIISCDTTLQVYLTYPNGLYAAKNVSISCAIASLGLAFLTIDNRENLLANCGGATLFRLYT